MIRRPTPPCVSVADLSHMFQWPTSPICFSGRPLHIFSVQPLHLFQWSTTSPQFYWQASPCVSLPNSFPPYVSVVKISICFSSQFLHICKWPTSPYVSVADLFVSVGMQTLHMFQWSTSPLPLTGFKFLHSACSAHTQRKVSSKLYLYVVLPDTNYSMETVASDLTWCARDQHANNSERQTQVCEYAFFHIKYSGNISIAKYSC